MHNKVTQKRTCPCKDSTNIKIINIFQTFFWFVATSKPFLLILGRDEKSLFFNFINRDKKSSLHQMQIPENLASKNGKNSKKYPDPPIKTFNIGSFLTTSIN